MQLLFCFGCVLWGDWEYFGWVNWAKSTAVQILGAFGLIVDFALKPSYHLKERKGKSNSQLHLLLSFSNCCLVSCSYTLVTRGCVYFQGWQFCLMNQLYCIHKGRNRFPPSICLPNVCVPSAPSSGFTKNEPLASGWYWIPSPLPDCIVALSPYGCIGRIC